jgi:dihydrofolate synthase/folylpolyglutamate synthase
MPKSLADWVSYINALHVREIDLGLTRIQQLATGLSLAQFTCPVVVIGGTNGKGSVVKLLETIYLAAGYRVAAYTSPHLLRFNERLRINNKEVADETLVTAFEYIENNRQLQPLTFFEFTTLAILYICQHTPLDILLLEVGLGGRLDAVNIVDSDVAVITNIALDHTDWLGDNREAIGREKVGIARTQKPLVCGDPEPPQSIVQTAEKLGANFYGLNQAFRIQVNNSTWDWIGPRLRYLCLPKPILKIENAATSLMVVDLLQPRLPVTQYGVITGVKKAQLAGRFERMDHEVPIILDVAHNPQSMQYLAEQLQQQSVTGRVLAVVGMLGDKDIEGSLVGLVAQIDVWYVADLDAVTPRGAKANRLTNYLATKNQKNCYNFSSVAAALTQAIAESDAHDQIVVFGSFYTVALAKQYLLGEKENGS